MSTSEPKPYRWTIAEYRELDKIGLFNDVKTMLLDGEFYVMPMPSAARYGLGESRRLPSKYVHRRFSRPESEGVRYRNAKRSGSGLGRRTGDRRRLHRATPDGRDPDRRSVDLPRKRHVDESRTLRFGASAGVLGSRRGRASTSHQPRSGRTAHRTRCKRLPYPADVQCRRCRFAFGRTHCFR